MPPRLRPFAATDVTHLAAVRAAAGARGWWGGGPGWYGSDQLLGTDDGVLRLAVTLADDFAGYGVCWRQRHDLFGLDFATTPGAADDAIPDLLAEVERWARHHQGAAIETRVNAANGALVSGLTERGFSEINRMVSQALELRRFDPARFSGPAERALAGGVAIERLPLEPERKERCLHRMHELRDQAMAERPIGYLLPSPAAPHDARGFERFLADLSGCRPELSVVAAIGGDWVGYSLLKERDGSAAGEVWQHMTAVDPRFQNRGIATALKIDLTARAKALGYATIRTATPSPPMRRVNERLGFVEDAPAELRMAKRWA
jgi:GNAT superfamily N-acetyltransferase